VFSASDITLYYKYSILLLVNVLL